MKTSTHRVMTAVLLAGILFAGNTAIAAKKAHHPITCKLIALVEADPQVGNLLEQSLAKAAEVNPDPVTNPAQTLSQYYDYLDEAVKLIPQNVLANPPHLIRQQILQSLCYFYFLIDQPLPELKNKGLYNNTIQYYEPFATWTRKFAKAWGSYLNTEKSWNQQTLQQFSIDPAFGLQTGWYESPANWKTFNQFFSKYLSSPDQRPVTAPKNEAVVVSPADSVPQGVWDINKKSEIQEGLTVKLAKFYSIPELLGKGSAYHHAFAGGVLTHTFLNVNDYHRYHFAVGGEVKECRVIQQNVALEVEWDDEAGKYDPLDEIGWQFTQTRGVAVIDTGKYGLVALIPMGMAQVSSVNFEDDIQVGKKHEKGHMLGHFLFGGSDFVMLFQAKAGFKLTAPKEDKDTYQHLLVGEQYGVMRGNK